MQTNKNCNLCVCLRARLHSLVVPLSTLQALHCQMFECKETLAWYLAPFPKRRKLLDAFSLSSYLFNYVCTVVAARSGIMRYAQCVVDFLLATTTKAKEYGDHHHGQHRRAFS